MYGIGTFRPKSGGRFYLAKIALTSIDPFVGRGELPFRSLGSQGSRAAPEAGTSTGTRVLGFSPVLLSARFLLQGILTADGQMCARVHLLLSVQVLSVYGKER